MAKKAKKAVVKKTTSIKKETKKAVVKKVSAKKKEKPQIEKKEVAKAHYVVFERYPDNPEDATALVVRVEGKTLRSKVEAWAAGSYGDRKHFVTTKISDKLMKGISCVEL